MNVLVVTNLAPLNSNPNAGIFVVRRLQHYSMHGVNFDAVSLGFENSKTVLLLKRFLRRPNTGNPLEEHEGVELKPVLIPRNLGMVLMNKVSRNYFVKTAERYAEWVEQSLKIGEYDLIHAHGMYDVPAGLIAKILAEKHRKPFIVTLHGSDVNILMPRRREIYVGILESASATIFVSKALLERAKSLGFSGRNAVVIPNGYDETTFEPLDKEMVRKELGMYKEGYKYVGFVGNLIPIKRADRLGEIFSLIAKEIPETFFIVVGDGPLRRRLEKETKGLNIIFTGRVPQTEVAKYMNAMDVMVLPSRNEGWPCVVLEAQACGTCVVGSSNGGIPEAIGFQEYVVEEGVKFEERFAERVVEVLGEGYDAGRLLERAKMFTWESTVTTEMNLYKRVKQSVNCYQE